MTTPKCTSCSKSSRTRQNQHSNLKSSSGQQLWSNLDTISKNNPSLLSSRDAYDKAFGYQGKDAGEKALVDAYWNAKKNDSNAIYNSLATCAAPIAVTAVAVIKPKIKPAGYCNEANALVNAATLPVIVVIIV